MPGCSVQSGCQVGIFSHFLACFLFSLIFSSVQVFSCFGGENSYFFLFFATVIPIFLFSECHLSLDVLGPPKIHIQRQQTAA